MRLKRNVGVATSLLFGSVLLAGQSAPAQAACSLQASTSKIKHIIHIQFDNVHLRRDNPNVPSDLEQMPNLLNFLQNNGTVSGNHHTPLISHTADDIVTTLTGVYGDRHGQPVSNSYGFFKAGGTVGFSSSFVYWTDPGPDGTPQMVNEHGKIAPAPWVPFTRAGCDVGAFSTANIELENVSSDISTVFGSNSPEAAEAASNHNMAVADFEGIAIHCAKDSLLCAASTHAVTDALPDEPNGYNSFPALFGNKYVAPVINSSSLVIKDLDGNPISDGKGNVGFPGFSPSASQTLGYIATMLEAGVPVVYAYIADAHDNHAAFGAFGPGEAGYVAQLQAYDSAFAKFFTRLAKDGITKDNTLFIVTADENDHFAGGPPSPANCDGIHVPCTYAKIGEVTTFLDRLLASQRGNTTPFDIHFDDAPNFYIHGNLGQTDPTTRTMEHDVDALQVTNPITGNKEKINVFLADRAEMGLLHMVTPDPLRTPTFTMFGNPDYFNQTAGNTSDCSQPPACVVENPGFAWNHGDVQQEITRTWLGLVGPGVQHLGRNDEVFSDHTDIRPTLLLLVRLKDDYTHDGRVLVEFLDDHALPHSLQSENFVELAQLYKQLNAPLGSVGMNSLVLANRSILADDTVYGKYLKIIGDIAEDRDELAAEMKKVLTAAAFENQRVDEHQEELIRRARKIIDRVEGLAKNEHDHH
ncbi:hypothetical protein [Bradyrhizobium genosp. P]|uniref:hypothetical protein n=1 Tax=Bradyrhizobium genosp. P TaxID=83641 RepID=UPI003CED125E